MPFCILPPADTRQDHFEARYAVFSLTHCSEPAVFLLLTGQETERETAWRRQNQELHRAGTGAGLLWNTLNSPP
jgi:hypothetical protein